MACAPPNSAYDTQNQNINIGNRKTGTMDEGDDSIPEPILNLRNMSSGEGHANNCRKRSFEESNGDDVSNLLQQEIGVLTDEDPPARERPAVRIFGFILL